MSVAREALTHPERYARRVTLPTLVRVLETLSDSYYNSGTPLASDEVFDRLRQVLKERDPSNAFLKKVRAPVRVASPARIASPARAARTSPARSAAKGPAPVKLPKAAKVDLPVPAPSLDKFDPPGQTDDVASWVQKFPGPYLIADKLDGVSALLIEGKVLATGGDALTATDSSHFIQYLFHPGLLAQLSNGVVRGELVISKANFALVEAKLGMKSARNAVAGALASRTLDEEWKFLVRHIDFFAYGWYHRTPQVLSHQYAALEWTGVRTPWSTSRAKIDQESLAALLTERREKSPYEVDGLVVSDVGSAHALTATNPTWARAFKTTYAAQTAVVTVRAIEWDPSMDGYLKPRVLYDPVRLVGGDLNAANGVGAAWIRDRGIGVGAVIRIKRAGDIIPNIVEVLTPAPVVLPSGEGIHWVGQDLVQTDGGSKVVVKRLLHAATVLDVLGLSEATLTRLVDAGYESFGAILRAGEKELAARVDRMGPKGAANLVASLKKSLAKADLAELIHASHALGRGVGKVKAAALVDALGPAAWTTDRPLGDCSEKIAALDGFSSTTADKICAARGEFLRWYRDVEAWVAKSRALSPPRRSTLSPGRAGPSLPSVVGPSLVGQLPSLAGQLPSLAGPSLAGQVVVFTGFRDRDLEAAIKSRGGSVGGSVTAKTTLVVYSGDRASTKITAAEAKGVAVREVGAWRREMGF